MLNITTIQGRFTKDPEVRNTSNQTAVCSFSLACERSFKGEDGKAEVDYIDCVAWKGKATAIGNYFHKGDMILVTGRLQKRSYPDKNGNTVYVSEVIVEDINFCGTAKSQSSKPVAPSIPDAPDTELPFEV